MNYFLYLIYFFIAKSKAFSKIPVVFYGGSFLLEAVQSFQQEEKAAGNPRDELKQYFNLGIEPTEDVILWLVKLTGNPRVLGIS